MIFFSSLSFFMTIKRLLILCHFIFFAFFVSVTFSSAFLLRFWWCGHLWNTGNPFCNVDFVCFYTFQPLVVLKKTDSLLIVRAKLSGVPISEKTLFYFPDCRIDKKPANDSTYFPFLEKTFFNFTDCRIDLKNLSMNPHFSHFWKIQK